VHDQERGHHEEHHHVVILHCAHLMVEHPELGDRDAHRFFGEPRHLVDQNLDDGAEREGDHGQVGTGDAQRGQGQDGAEEGGHRRYQANPIFRTSTPVTYKPTPNRPGCQWISLRLAIV
jgi:hypothetical protein